MSCVLCNDHHPDEIWRNSRFYVIDAKDPFFHCFLRVISCRHVAEMSDLTLEERTELWNILDIIERTMLTELHPDKINLAQFGNMVPHLHWHLIARWKDDTHFPECPWGARQRNGSESAQLQRREMLEALKPILAAKLTNLFGR